MIPYGFTYKKAKSVSEAEVLLKEASEASDEIEAGDSHV